MGVLIERTSAVAASPAQGVSLKCADAACPEALQDVLAERKSPLLHIAAAKGNSDLVPPDLNQSNTTASQRTSTASRSVPASVCLYPLRLLLLSDWVSLLWRFRSFASFAPGRTTHLLRYTFGHETHGA